MHLVHDWRDLGPLVLKTNIQTSCNIAEAQIQGKPQSAYLCFEVQIPQLLPSPLLILAQGRALSICFYHQHSALDLSEEKWGPTFTLHVIVR